MSDHTYYRARTPEGSGVTVRRTGREVRLSVGSSQRMRCNATEAMALLIALADAFEVDVLGVPEWAANTEIEVSDR